MIKITKREAEQLREMGVKDNTNGISHTYGHHKHYYLCESLHNRQILSQIRK
jgi:hypothetical protein